ncbi:MAG: hypothetical protein P4L38_09935 [Syntrophaceae bacterium]|nr:hypothetical protein [Syntrophaceae bacterium]
MKPTTMLNMAQILSHATQYKAHSPKKATKLKIKIESIILDFLLRDGAIVVAKG